MDKAKKLKEEAQKKRDRIVNDANNELNKELSTYAALVTSAQTICTHENKDIGEWEVDYHTREDYRIVHCADCGAYLGKN